MLGLPTDGDVQAQSPLDGALVPASSESLSSDGDTPCTGTKRPGDEAGVCYKYAVLCIYECTELCNHT